MTELGLFEAMYTARALRRLKPDPVSEELITKVLDAAVRAPSGGNAQNWIFIVVRDEEQRRRLGAVYRKASDEVAEIYAARGRPAHLSDEQYQRLALSQKRGSSGRPGGGRLRAWISSLTADIASRRRSSSTRSGFISGSR